MREPSEKVPGQPQIVPARERDVAKKQDRRSATFVRQQPIGSFTGGHPAKLGGNTPELSVHAVHGSRANVRFRPIADVPRAGTWDAARRLVR